MRTRSLVLTEAVPLAESERQRAWDDFVVSGKEPRIVPLVRDSWMRSRDQLHIDPALKRSPIVLADQESRERIERLALLQLGLPFLEQITEGLHDTQDMLAL